MDINHPFVITISRELGSGGRTIGRKLAAQLNVRYSDKNLIQNLMEQFKLSTYEIERIKGKKKNWLSDFVEAVAPVPNTGAFVGFDPIKGNDWNNSYVKVDDIFEAESQIIRGIAEEGSCVLAGRSGFFVLKDHPNKVDIFIQAPLEKRIERVMKKQGLSEKEASDVIESVDKSRENYVQRWAGVSRYDARNYDLVINVGDMTDDDAVTLILKYLKYSK
ncbi:MAG: cytidylate kinase-like family protein [Bacteroidales bacterium]|nr:cytidylate kinase-like family protein [Bacteroidales bacterium]